MSDMDILREMIKENAQENLQYENDKAFVILRETTGKPYTVTIRELPPDALIIKIDASFKQPDTVFKSGNGECSRADYAIISAKQKRIIYIEMKKRKPNEPGKTIKQLKGAHCFIVYCKEVGKLFWNNENFLRDCKYRFFEIGHTNIPKNSTRSGRKRKQYNAPDTPEKHEKIARHNDLEFKRLAW